MSEFRMNLVSQNVSRLANTLLLEFGDIKADKSKETITQKYIQKVKNFNYDLKNGTINYLSNIEMIESRSLDLTKLNEFINLVRTKDCYKETKDSIMQFKDVSEMQVDFWLTTFLRKVLTEIFLKDANLAIVTPLVHRFLNDLQDGSIEWNITTFLSGLIIESPPINIDKNVILRKPSENDVELFLNRNLLELKPFSISHTSAVLIVDTMDRIQPFVYPEIDKYILLLRLFQKGSVNIIINHWMSNSLINFGDAYGWPNYIPFPNEKYTIKKEDEEKLRTFVAELKLKLPIDNYGQLTMNDYIGISIARYQDAILKNEDFVNRISYIIMGLEALYLESQERGELSLRLAQRVSKFVNLVSGEDILKVFNIMKEAYEIRSDFVHGSVKDKDRTNIKDLFDTSSEYLRKSIVGFLLLRDKKPKEDFIGLIDNTILEPRALEKMEKLIEPIRKFIF